MVRVPTPGSPRGYCIDTTEVTVSHYHAFLKSGYVHAPGEPADCRAVISHAAAPPEPDRPPSKCLDNARHPEASVKCAGYCDAYAFCAWAGKRLCGKRGGGAVDVAATTDPNVDEWMYACTNGGTTRQPYGDDALAGRCQDSSSEGSAGPSSASKCRGVSPPFERIVDMVGSESEWENACHTWDAGKFGASLYCRHRGGDFSNDATVMSCAAQADVGVGQSHDLGSGIRCCAD